MLFDQSIIFHHGLHVASSPGPVPAFNVAHFSHTMLKKLGGPEDKARLNVHHCNDASEIVFALHYITRYSDISEYTES